MAATFLRQAERAFLLRKTTGFTAQTPVGQLRRVYYATYLGGDNSAATLADLEARWMKKYITDQGATPIASDYAPELWQQIVASIGKTPSKFMNDNQLTFYLNAA